MAKRLLRTIGTGVLALTTTLAATGPMGGTAFAAPLAPVPGVPPAPGAADEPAADALTDSATEATEAAEAAEGTDTSSGATDSLTGSIPGSAPGTLDGSVTGLLTRLRTLYQEAEQATEAYNAADEALKKQTADTRRTDALLTAARRSLQQGRDEAGRLARLQYQGRSDLSPYLTLLLARHPQTALDETHQAARAARSRSTVVQRLQAAEQKADGLATASRTALARGRALLADRKKQKEAVEAKLREVEKLLASLTADQLGRLTSLDAEQTAGAQSTLMASGALDGARTPSPQGARALRFAVRQIGKPYEWGAEGPDTYDCSGLTQQSWAAAGRALPRTSQEQWAKLPHVPLNRLRPGDLIVYFPKATHIALYLGHGLVVQAPRPGTRIKVSPIAANPLLGAVRPDPGGAPLKTFAPPELPEGASNGADTGFGGTRPADL
ncbi:NlpC/P60 family protein [Streptomyces sp. NPDC046203]|uniref:C40 family peptidase n=1 Tax=Streptomyces sp. NPDC046203 TaxID=3154602 RepID=UPI0033CC942F